MNDRRLNKPVSSIPSLSNYRIIMYLGHRFNAAYHLCLPILSPSPSSTKTVSKPRADPSLLLLPSLLVVSTVAKGYSAAES